MKSPKSTSQRTRWTTMKTLRSLRATAKGYRTATLCGRKYVVVPVVALVEGVLHAANADTPELVLAEEFSRLPETWNDRAVVWDHPSKDGERVSANSTEMVEQMHVGRVYNAHVVDRELRMEAWLEVERAESLPEAERILERVKDGETLDVSVGVYVNVQQAQGIRNGHRYSGVWRNIQTDHLAILPEGRPGACSVEMGCGAQRSASSEGKMKKTFKELQAAHEGALALRGGESESDSDVRRLLHDALFSSEPAFLGVTDVFPGDKKVVYATAPDGALLYYRRSFEATEGEVELGSDVEEVRMETSYAAAAEKVYEKDGKYCHRATDGKEMCHTTREEAEKMMKNMSSAGSHKVAASNCGCGAGDAKDASAGQEDEMDPKKLARAKAIVASGKTCFKEASVKVLASLPEDELKALEDHVEKESEPVAEEETPVETPVETPKETSEPKEASRKPLTEDEYLAQAPESVRAIVAQHKAREASRRTEIVKLIGASSHKDVYTKQELESKSLEELEKLAKIVGAASASVDNSGRGLPRAVSSTADERPKTPDIDAKMREMRERRRSA